MGTLDLFPSLEQPQSQYQQADAGDELAEATPKSLCPFLSPTVLWDAQMVLWQAGHRAAEPHLPVGPWASSLPGDLVSGNWSLPAPQHLQLSLQLFQSGSLGTLLWEQRDPCTSDVLARARGVFSAQGSAPGGRKNCGSTPEAGSWEPGCVFWAQRLGCRSCCFHLTSSMDTVSCSESCAHLQPHPTCSLLTAAGF